MKRNHHQIAAGVSAYTWREDDGWYSEIASDEPGDAGTDPEGPFDTEADALSAARRTHRQLTQVRADIAQEAQTVAPTDLLGSTEVAALLSWDRRKVATYHQRGVLPRPLRRLASGPVWRRQDIEAYAEQHKPRPVRTTAELIAMLQALAGDQQTVGRYTELAWREGLLVTGCLGTAEGVALEAGDSAYTADPTPARLVAPTAQGYAQPQGVHPDAPLYVPVVLVTDDAGEPQVTLWDEAR